MTRALSIINAIKSGARTSPEIAKRLGISRDLTSVYLHRMAGRGLVSRGSRVDALYNHAGGQPCIRWKLAEAAQ